MSEIKDDTLKYQTLVWGELKNKLEKHRKDLQVSKGNLMKMIFKEYYSKINTDYNK